MLKGFSLHTISLSNTPTPTEETLERAVSWESESLAEPSSNFQIRVITFDTASIPSRSASVQRGAGIQLVLNDRVRELRRRAAGQHWWLAEMKTFNRTSAAAYNWWFFGTLTYLWCLINSHKTPKHLPSFWSLLQNGARIRYFIQPWGTFLCFLHRRRGSLLGAQFMCYCLTCFVSLRPFSSSRLLTHTRPAWPSHCAVFILTKLYGASCCTTPGQRVLTLSILSACLRRTLSDPSSMLPCDSCCSFQQRLLIKTFKSALTCSFSPLSNGYCLLFPL